METAHELFTLCRPSDQGQSLLPALANRLTVFPLVALLAVAILRKWRGGKAFTMRCLKCGTPFCRRCHLGQVAGGLCSQCHHLFLVRDGVSGPARNRKLLEVQAEEARRDRVFRVLSLLVPGAGHLFEEPGALEQATGLAAPWLAQHLGAAQPSMGPPGP